MLQVCVVPAAAYGGEIDLQPNPLPAIPVPCYIEPGTEEVAFQGNCLRMGSSHGWLWSSGAALVAHLHTKAADLQAFRLLPPCEGSCAQLVGFAVVDGKVVPADVVANVVD
jgi:hypothetical protein